MLDSSDELPLPDRVIREAVPDDEVVLAYVARGALARYVEGVAARNAGFREELEACIDGLEEAGEPISAVARAWRTGAAPAVVAAVVPLAPRRARSPAMLVAIALAAAFFLVAGFAKLRHDEAMRVEAQKEAEIARQQAEIERIRRELKDTEDAIAVAQAEAASAKSDADRAAAMAKLEAAQQQQRKAGARVNAVGAAAKTGTAKPACRCAPGDPLCSCL